VGHVAHAKKMKNSYRILSEILNERDNLRKIYVDGRVILKCKLKN
jgi:hypothetical protein